jgi:hypothetical protein
LKKLVESAVGEEPWGRTGLELHLHSPPQQEIDTTWDNWPAFSSSKGAGTPAPPAPALGPCSACVPTHSLQPPPWEAKGKGFSFRRKDFFCLLLLPWRLLFNNLVCQLPFWVSRG